MGTRRHKKNEGLPMSMFLSRTILLACMLTLAACGPFAPTDAEKAMCLTAGDLIERGGGRDVDRSEEKWLAIRSFGTHQLRYDYNDKNGGSGALFIQCQALKQRTGVEAMVTYRMQKVVSKAIAIGKIEDKQRTEGNCKGADACVLIDLRVGNRVIGNHFVLRSGRHVVSVSLLGTYFDDPDEWRDLVARKVEAIKKLE
jgi:hypothetical protein